MTLLIDTSVILAFVFEDDLRHIAVRELLLQTSEINSAFTSSS